MPRAPELVHQVDAVAQRPGVQGPRSARQNGQVRDHQGGVLDLARQGRALDDDQVAVLSK